MNGEAIGAQALADAGLRRLATERSGPRPGGVRQQETSGAGAEARRAAVGTDARTTRPGRI